MDTIYVGSDGSFRTGWQFWKVRYHQSHHFVLAYKNTVGLRSTNDDGDEDFIWSEGADEDDLPDGIYVDGVTVTDERSQRETNIDTSQES